jgi:hypothetical protein
MPDGVGPPEAVGVSGLAVAGEGEAEVGVGLALSGLGDAEAVGVAVSGLGEALALGEAVSGDGEAELGLGEAESGEGEADSGDGDPDCGEGDPDCGEGELLDDEAGPVVGTGGGGLSGGVPWNSKMAIRIAKAAIRIINSQLARIDPQPERSRRPGQGSGQIRVGPGAWRSIQGNR